MKVAIYPGSFDPLTYGHINIIKRGLRLFDKLIVAVAINTSKKTIFTVDERIKIISSVFKNEPKVEVDSFTGLLVDYFQKKKADVVLRGLRTVSDFEYELQMALANKKLNGEVETFFMMTDGSFSYHRSTIIKEIIELGGTAKGMVPEIVEKMLKKKLKR